MRAKVYPEDGWLLYDGAPIGGSEPDPPLTLNLAEAVTLTSGFAIRDEWKIAVLVDLSAARGVDVARMIDMPALTP